MHIMRMLYSNFRHSKSHAHNQLLRAYVHYSWARLAHLLLLLLQLVLQASLAVRHLTQLRLDLTLVLQAQHSAISMCRQSITIPRC